MLQHKFEIENKDGSKETRTSTLIEYGDPKGGTHPQRLPEDSQWQPPTFSAVENSTSGGRGKTVPAYTSKYRFSEIQPTGIVGCLEEGLSGSAIDNAAVPLMHTVNGA
ncbi:hypothetical protein G7Y89_g5770 [Cudoniella acicularis]|uniref:Uncharacterized protein n=1 Tax=Cudoniella acicularis TaxID=354080 RepID=A0A8H4W665_9HELO|nr:hypothetical protein G7Y89_g5770 [Cudoniella acicularis]